MLRLKDYLFELGSIVKSLPKQIVEIFQDIHCLTTTRSEQREYIVTEVTYGL